MIKARKILIYMNVEEIPYLLASEEKSRELCEFAEEFAYRIACKYKQAVVLPLSLSPVKLITKNVVRSTTFKELYKVNILKALEGIDAIAELPGLGKVSTVPEWIKDEAEKKYITIAPFASFFSKQDADNLYVETSRRRLSLVKAILPTSRINGRGGRRK